MEKENLITKLNIKDYNNELEKILSKKTFSEDTKNLLLNMLYKIENAYDDYNLVKGDTKTKKETLEELLSIISRDCKTIEIIKDKHSKNILDEGKIITYLNARKMLFEIYQIDTERFYIPKKYEIIKSALEETLNEGYSIASAEIIRDFDGWSWNIVLEEIENISSNLIYQVLSILVGSEFLKQWRQSKKQDYILKLIDMLENRYKTELAEKLFKVINQVAMINVSQSNKEYKTKLIEIQEKLQEEYEIINNKQEYVARLTKEKKEIVGKIKHIDTTINNDRNLKNEFIKRNELLDMNHRIFSLSDFVEILEKEREDLIIKLNECSKKMEPLNFIKTKTDIENKLYLIKELELKEESKRIYDSKVKELLNLVCDAIKIKINNIEGKENIIKLIYQIRYFSLIYVDKNKQVKDTIDVNAILKMIITKGCKNKCITIFSKNIKENYYIIKNIFETDIIELEKIYIKFIQKQDIVILEIYDEDNLYKTIELSKIDELNVKPNKKHKIFI